MKFIAFCCLVLCPGLATAASWEDYYPEHAEVFHNGNVASVKRLLQKNGDVYKDPNTQRLALSHAILSGNIELIKYLKRLGWLDNCRNSNDCHPIHSLARLGKDIPMLEYFLAEGFDINAVSPAVQMTPLQEVTRYRNVKIVKLLCEHGADPNASHRLRNGSVQPSAHEEIKNALSTANEIKQQSESLIQARSILNELNNYFESGQCMKK